MQAIYFILDTLATLYQFVLLLRLLMQLTRADFRNPIGRAVLQLTDPLVRPLRKVLPPMGKVDSATLAAVILFTALKVWLLALLLPYGAPSLAGLLTGTLLDVLRLTLRTYLFSMILNAILSFVAPGNHSPAQQLLASICDPVLNPIRRHIPSVAGLDLSPLWACIAIQALLLILP